jgi:polar amino acid transport system ATP-binding protein
MRFAREVASAIHVTDKGRIIETNNPRDLIGAPQDERTQAFLDKIL